MGWSWQIWLPARRGIWGGDIFPALSLPAIMVASHGAGSEFPTADGSVNVPPQTNYEKNNNVDPNGSTYENCGFLKSY